MSSPSNGATADRMQELPAFSLDVQALDLGAEVKAVGLELLETESREPVRGGEAVEFWAAAFPLLAGGEPFGLDFSAIWTGCVIFARRIKSRFANPARAACWFRSLPGSSSSSFSRDLKRRRLASARANGSGKTMLLWPASFPGTEWTAINLRINAIPFARFVSWKTAG